MLIAMKLSPCGVRPDLWGLIFCLRLPVRGSDWGDAGLRLFFMGLPKSKAQIAGRRYWVVPTEGFWFFCLRGALGVLLWRWPFLDLLLVY
jgi:hypothetical protein